MLTGWRRRSADTAALSSVISRMSTAYTDDPNWSSFAAARESQYDEYFSTQTYFADGPEFTSSALSVASTADDPSAAISSIISQSIAAVDEYVSLYIEFVSTQTYLEEDARSGLQSDLQVFTSLVDDATNTDGDNAPGSTTSTTSATISSRMATPRTQTSVSTEVVVKTRSSATTPAATSLPAGATASATAATGGVAGAPAVNGVVAGAFAGLVAVVGLL